MRDLHGDSVGGKMTTEYMAWDSMKRRCFSKKHPKYKHYGARGVSVCKRWMCFSKFLKDMGRKPTKEHSLDRIDVNGGYEPSNCRWATNTEQQRNRRDNVYVVFNGERMVLGDFAKIVGRPVQSVGKRLRLFNETPEEIFIHFTQHPYKRKQTTT